MPNNWSRFKKAIDKCPNYLNRYSPIIAALATVVIAVWTIKYTTYSKGQWVIMQNAAKESTANFVMAQRAFVNVGSQDGRLMRLVPLQVGEPVTIALHLQNSGHLPATRVIVNFSVGAVIKSGQRIGLQNRPHHITACDPAKDVLNEHPFWEESIIPANSAQTRYLRIADAKLSEGDLRGIKANGYDISVIGFIEYCDGFGEVHCLTFCAAYKQAPIDDFTLCQRGNLDYCAPGFAPSAPLNRP